MSRGRRQEYEPGRRTGIRAGEEERNMSRGRGRKRCKVDGGEKDTVEKLY